ncbi:hypothetical protein IJS98_00255 [bacterium]|nr:hypothetical protein [bacterium]
MKGKLFGLAVVAMLSSLFALADMTVVYENDFEDYNLGEVRKPVQDAAVFLEYDATTNLVHCNVEAGEGVDGSQAVHAYILKEGDKSVNGGAQFNSGLDLSVFSQTSEVVYEMTWRGGNMASYDLTDGTNLFFSLFGNGGAAVRACVTNLVNPKIVHLKNEETDPGVVSFSGSYGVYKIHVLFPDGRITLIERDYNGKHYEFPQVGVYGMPGVKPTHLGGGIRARGYGKNDRNCYFDNLKVSYETINNPVLNVSGKTKVLINDADPVLNVNNIGTGSFTANVEVLEGSGYFSFEEDTEHTGAFSVEVTKTTALHTVIDREALGVAFGRAKVKVTGAGDEQILTYYVQSGNPEEGYMLYQSDFEDVILGPVTEMDPNWVPSGTIEGCEVVQDPEAGQCLKIQTAKALHLNCNMPTGMAEQYDVKVAMKVCMPNYSVLSRVYLGTDLSHRQGEYSLHPSAEGEVSLTCDNCADKDVVGNKTSTDEWFDLEYTYSSLVENRILRSVKFGDEFYDLNIPIDLGDASGIDKDFFNQFRIYASASDTLVYFDDIYISLVPRGQGKPPVMRVEAAYDPVPFDVNNIPVKIFNDGGGSFDYQVRIIDGLSNVRLSKSQGTVELEDSMELIVRRSQMGFGFYTSTLRFSSTTEGVESFDLKVHIQSGNPEEGYVIYESDFNDLLVTTEEEEGLKNELSEQDSCWLITNPKNRIDVIEDPYEGGNKCLRLVDLNHSSSGYHLALNIASNYVDDFDVVYAMRLNIPESYVSDEELGTALFCISQENSSRKCEAKLYLNTEDSSLPVYTHLEDLDDQEWWGREVETAERVENSEWFNFYMRFNCKFVDYDHKTLIAYNFGNNEYRFEGEEGHLTYPNGIASGSLEREDLTKLKLYSYKKSADILVDDLRVLLLPKAVPEPAFLGLLLLVAAFARRAKR